MMLERWLILAAGSASADLVDRETGMKRTSVEDDSRPGDGYGLRALAAARAIGERDAAVDRQHLASPQGAAVPH